MSRGPPAEPVSLGGFGGYGGGYNDMFSTGLLYQDPLFDGHNMNNKKAIGRNSRVVGSHLDSLASQDDSR